MYSIVVLLFFGIAAAQVTQYEASIPTQVQLYGLANELDCSSLVNDDVGICYAWQIKRTFLGSNNFGRWIQGSTIVNDSLNTISINGAPPGIIPDYYAVYESKIGGILSQRKVKTTINMDVFDCFNPPSCTWLGDRRNVVDVCRNNTMNNRNRCSEVQYAVNVVKGTYLGVGRQFVVDTDMTNQKDTIKVVETSGNKVSSNTLSGSTASVDVKGIRYYKSDNRSQIFLLGQSVKDSTLSAIIRAIFGKLSSVVVRAVVDNGKCSNVITMYQSCPSASNNKQKLPSATPVANDDNCTYNSNNNATAIWIDLYSVRNMISAEAYDLFTQYEPFNVSTSSEYFVLQQELFYNGTLGYNTSLLPSFG